MPMPCRCFACLSCVTVLLLTPVVSADDIVISEIMYDPASDDRWPAKTEWVEIYNRGDESVSLQGWHLSNERGQTRPIQGDIAIEPGEAVVLIPGTQATDAFHAAWGDGFQAIPLDGWHQPGLHQLTNEPDDETGALTLRRSAGDLADEVNYRNEGRWPNNKPDGPSIYLLPHAVDTTSNDDGSNWVRAEADRHGARHAEPDGGYDPRDVGSPGTVVAHNDSESDEADAATSE